MSHFKFYSADEGIDQVHPIIILNFYGHLYFQLKRLSKKMAEVSNASSSKRRPSNQTADL